MEIYIDNQMWRGVVAAFSTGVIIFTGHYAGTSRSSVAIHMDHRDLESALSAVRPTWPLLRPLKPCSTVELYRIAVDAVARESTGHG